MRKKKRHQVGGELHPLKILNRVENLRTALKKDVQDFTLTSDSPLGLFHTWCFPNAPQPHPDEPDSLLPSKPGLLPLFGLITRKAVLKPTFSASKGSCMTTGV